MATKKTAGPKKGIVQKNVIGVKEEKPKHFRAAKDSEGKVVPVAEVTKKAVKHDVDFITDFEQRFKASKGRKASFHDIAKSVVGITRKKLEVDLHNAWTHQTPNAIGKPYGRLVSSKQQVELKIGARFREVMHMALGGITKDWRNSGRKLPENHERFLDNLVEDCMQVSLAV